MHSNSTVSRSRTPTSLSRAASALLGLVLLAACSVQQASSPTPKTTQTANEAQHGAGATSDAKAPPADNRSAPRSLAGAAAAPPADAAREDEAAPVDWPLQSAFGSRLRFVGEHGVRFVEELAARSEGRIALTFFEPGAHVPSGRIGEAVASGALAAGYTAPAYLATDEPALAIFAGTPFGPSAEDHYAWLRDGGGLALQDTLYERMGLKGVPCAIAGPEGFGWFRRAVDTPADLRGRRVRADGLPARVLARLGVIVMPLPGADIGPALARGALDGAEFSMPYLDVDLGLGRVAPHYYAPGPLQPFSVYEVVFNRARWQALAEPQKRLIEDICHDNVLHALAQDGPMASDALSTIRKLGVTVAPLPVAVADAARDAWSEVVAELSAANADFARIYAAYRQYLSQRPSGDPLRVAAK